mmetsp:Transcript_143762/g.374436  ORF Transcript_143762/g.374436 Transcript_143762/m.374436 type:complete len:219 (-) Transcript_143762:107-763(-)
MGSRGSGSPTPAREPRRAPRSPSRNPVWRQGRWPAGKRPGTPPPWASPAPDRRVGGCRRGGLRKLQLPPTARLRLPPRPAGSTWNRGAIFGLPEANKRGRPRPAGGPRRRAQSHSTPPYSFSPPTLRPTLPHGANARATRQASTPISHFLKLQSRAPARWTDRRSRRPGSPKGRRAQSSALRPALRHQRAMSPHGRCPRAPRCRRPASAQATRGVPCC